MEWDTILPPEIERMDITQMMVKKLIQGISFQMSIILNINSLHLQGYNGIYVKIPKKSMYGIVTSLRYVYI